MRWIAIRGVAALLLSAVCVAANAQTTWRDIPCAQSLVLVAAASGVACQVQQPLVESANVPTNYSAVGTLNDVRVNLRLTHAKAPNHFRPYPEQESVRSIRGFAAEIMGAGLTDWSGPSAQRALVFMTFRAKDRTCIGFDIPGPPHSREAPAHLHGWVLRGLLCPPDGQPTNRRAVIRYLESVRVAVADPTRNVMGTELQPWP
ncbi:MAG: hypothetical protein JNK67_15530 [Alphaproteobacteria bacterium]|nr:hypothetical protein [Alphaproteobacteria bacterium]